MNKTPTNRIAETFKRNSLSLTVMGVMLIAPWSYSWGGNYESGGYESQGRSDTKVERGYAQPKEKTKEELEDEKMEAYYTPRDDIQLPERLHEYEEPEYFDEQAVERLNAPIPSTVEGVYRHKVKNEPLTVVVGSNEENTEAISEVINLSDYYDTEAEDRQEQAREATGKYLRHEVTKAELEKEFEEMVFPVVTKMKPTRMPASRMELKPEAKDAVTTPMVYIGMDEYSLNWFKMNLDTFNQWKPVIFLTQIDSIVDLRQVQRLAPELTFVPVESEQALQQFGVDFYPVMITPEGIFQ